ncbi:MAG: hypothetical protein ABIV06_05090 [Thermoanaerobaculia bacterium]
MVRSSWIPRSTLVAVFILAAFGCGKPTSPPAAHADPAVPAAAAPAQSLSAGAAVLENSGAAAAPHSGGGAGERALATEGSTVTTASFGFDLPATWRREQPSSGMRLAQAVVPGEAGPGELAVFHFGAGQGGGVESNFDRWLGQIEAAKGAKPERGELTVGGFKISWIDARGTLLPSTMGSGPTTPQPGFRLIGAVVEGEGGPLFFKLTGPDATLGAEREAFFGLLRSVRRP